MVTQVVSDYVVSWIVKFYTIYPEITNPFHSVEQIKPPARHSSMSLVHLRLEVASWSVLLCHGTGGAWVWKIADIQTGSHALLMTKN